MSEQIKVVLEADSKQLTAEFLKARTAAEAFSKKTLPGVSASLNHAFVQGERLRKGMEAGTKGFKLSGQGMLQFAHFADDAQYGMRGIMNNIPGLVMGLGLGGGVAGAVSLATLGLSKLIPALTGASEAADPTAVNEYGDKIRSLRGGLEDLARAKGEAAGGEFVKAIKAEREQMERFNAQLELNVALTAARRLAAGKVAGANDALSIARIAADPTLTREEKSDRQAAIQKAAARRAAQAELDGLREKAMAADRASKDSKENFRRSREEQAALRSRIASEEAALRTVAGRQSAAATARENIPAAAARVDEITAGGYGAFRVPGSAKKTIAAYDQALAEANATLLDLRRTAGGGRKDAAEAARLEGSLEAQRAALTELVNGEGALRAAAEKTRMQRELVLKSTLAEADAIKKSVLLEERRNQVLRQRPNEGEWQPFQWEPGSVGGAENERLNRELEERRRQQSETRQRYEDARISQGIGGVVDSDRQVALERARAMARSSKIRRSSGISVGSGGMFSRLEGPRGLGRTAEEINRRNRDASSINPGRDVERLLREIAQSSEATAKGLRAIGVL